MRKSSGLPLVLFVVFATIASACGGLPQLSDYRQRSIPLAQTSFLYASDGSLITELHAGVDRVILSRTQMPQTISDAVVAIEDKRFYYHHGFDLRAIIRAAYADVSAGHIVEGGSTITQQLVKQLYVGDDETLRRKIDEAVLAWQLEDRLTKDQILTKYLNTVYFGQGAYGIQAAARSYFGVDAKDLTLSQSALLAGLIRAPNDFDPFAHPVHARVRRNNVLRQMLDQGMITSSQKDEAVAEPIELHAFTSRDRYPFPYFVDYFKQWFLSNPAFGKTREDRYQLLFTGGLRITTTIDPQFQRYAQSAVRSVLPYPGDPSGAMTVIDPRTGYVRAMVGGDDADYWDANSGDGRVNLATGGSTGRQAGSSFKPFALVAALENGISPSTVFSAPSSIDIPLDNGEVWHVTNAEPSNYGSLTLEQATISSVNTVYAQLIDELGAQTVVDVAKRMGIRCCQRVSEPKRPLLPYLSAVLGTNEVNTLEMSSAYGTLATGGQHVNPIPVISILDADGHPVWQANPNPKQVVDPAVASAADQILQKVVLYGTGTAANIGRPQIGKTGTNQNYADAWFVGAIPQLVAAVWVGFPQGQISMYGGFTRITVFGGTWPAQIWRLFMEKAAATFPVRSFPTPDVNYVAVAVDVTQDPYCLPNQFTLPQNIQTLEFIAGTEPTRTCTEPTSLQSIPVPSVVGLSQAAAMTILGDAGFYVKVVLAVSTQPPGTVISQSPSAGVSAYQTSSVLITVSKDLSSPSP
ncbi:MAG: penicillin-binding protein [Actinomycetota bacterium]